MSFVIVTEINKVAHIKLNRPDVRNAFNPEMIEQIKKTFVGLNQRRDIRAVALSGEGKVFCAGADLNWMKAMVNFSFEQNRQDSSELFGMYETIAKFQLPLVGLAHGSAFGGALGLLACCDYVVAEDDTQFCFSETKLGLVPAVISSFVARKTHLGFVKPWMISGQIFSAPEAHRTGLVQELVPAGQGPSALQKRAETFCEAGPDAVRETKKLLYDLPHLNSEQIRDRTSRVIAERRVSSEGQEGLKSFLEKRSPSWRDG